jgi:pimeloyl-ACP methyl ester carboxylesterase
MATFGLVHGAWHGAWYWERLSLELTARGHTAVAMDLPCDDPGATFDRYADSVEAALGDATEPILVGHSLGGATLPFVARRRPVRLLVYLCGVVPATRETAGALDEPPDSTGIFKQLERDPEGCSYWPPGTAGALYPDLSAEDSAWAQARLRRQCRGIWGSFTPFERLDDLPSVTVIGRRDMALPPEWSRWVAAKRLGVEPVEMDSGHFPMISDPSTLADLLMSFIS